METAKGKAQEENLSNRIDSFEKYTYPHARLVAELATRLARRFGLTPQDTHAVGEAALLHDIGLLAMTPAYHARRGLLNYEERMDLWRHAVIGEQQMAKREASRHAQLLVRWHHEWWCGLGYPDMLAFEDIPIGARLLRAVELYGALIGDRPYRAAMSAEQALETLKAAAGIECDPYVVKALVALLEDLRAQATAPPTATIDPATVSPPLDSSAEPSTVEAAPPVDELAASEPQADLAEVANEAATVAPGELTLPEPASEMPAPPAALNGESLANAPTQPEVREEPTTEPTPVEWLLSGGRWRELKDEQAAKWSGWRSSCYNRKSLLGFEASVLRQIEFRSVAIPFFGWTRLDLYLKAWGKAILANDPRPWAATVARAMLDAPAVLGEDQITRLLEDVYVPGVRLANPELRRWFSESDAWWMDNLRRNIESLEDESYRAQALMIGMMTGDYALSFTDETREFRRPLTTIFWRLAGRALAGPSSYAASHCANLPVESFLRQARADLLYLTLPTANTTQSGAEARSEWRDVWVRADALAEPGDLDRLTTAAQSKHAYLAMLDRLLRAAAHLRTWAIGYQEIGLASVAEITELIQEHRPVRATYSKDLTEVTGGLRNYIIIADRAAG